MNKMTFGLVIDFCISCKFLNFRTKTLPIQFLCQMPIKNRFPLMNYSELWMNEEFRVILVSLCLKNDEMWSESQELLHWKDILCTGNYIPKKKKECKKVRSFSGRLIPIPCESLKKNNLMSENYMRVFLFLMPWTR